VVDTIDRLPQAGDRGKYLKEKLKDKLIEHKQEIDRYGEGLPEIRNWKWSLTGGGQTGVSRVGAGEDKIFGPVRK
jgi:hypothetical protein